jgi:hypothetical protein
MAKSVKHDHTVTACPNAACPLHDVEVMKKYKDDSHETYIKVHVPGESFWARDLGPVKGDPFKHRLAKVCNVLMSGECSFNDIIEIDSNNEFVKLVSGTTSRCAVYYDIEGKQTEEIKNCYRKVYGVFNNDKTGFYLEGAVAGMAFLSYPIDVTLKTLKSMAKTITEFKVTVK